MNLEDFTLVELRQLAKEKGIKGVSKFKRDELIEQLNNAERMDDEKEESDNTETNVSARAEKAKDEIAESEKENANIVQEVKVVDGYTLSAGDRIAEGILEILPDGYGFLRGKNYLSTQDDIYISPIQIRRFKLDNGDKIKGIARNPKEGEKFPALIFVGEVNGQAP